MKPAFVQLSVLALSLLVVTAHAADAQQNRPTLGVLVGASISTMKGNAIVANVESRKGLVAGLSLVSASRARFQLEIDGLYTDRGYVEPNPMYRLAFNVSYVDVPLLARVALAGGRSGSVFVVAGPSLNVRVRCSLEIDDPSGSASQSCKSSDADTKVSRTDVAFVIGGGAHVVRNRADIGAGARYQIGTSEISKNLDAKHRGFVVFLTLGKAGK